MLFKKFEEKFQENFRVRFERKFGGTLGVRRLCERRKMERRVKNFGFDKIWVNRFDGNNEEEKRGHTAKTVLFNSISN